MNRTIIAFIFMISIATSLITSFYSGRENAENIHNELTSNLKETTQIYLRSLTKSIRNNLLLGNIREARITLEEIIDSNLITGYMIINDEKVISSNTSNVHINDNLKIDIDIFFSDFGERWGNITYYVSTGSIKTTSNKAESLFISAFMFSTSLNLLLFLAFFIFLIICDIKLRTIIEKFFLYNFNQEIPSFLKIAWLPLIAKVKDIAIESHQIKEDLIETEQIKLQNKISRQVSHDIRSPLAALNVALEDISSLPEKNRLILKMAIQRIQDIANNLLKNSQVNDSPRKVSSLLYPILDEILSEKRIQYKSQSNLSISGSFNIQSQLFAEINPPLLKQIISNLINNSVEAIDNAQGRIELVLFQQDGQAIIEITDNGKGIPEEIIKDLGVKNISYGKQSSLTSGFGIGVKHAFDTIESWSGTITVLSQVGVGTAFKISLPLAITPKWFVNEIRLNPNHVILILDDDQEIHQVWDKKFEQFSLKRHHFYNSNKLREWIQNNPDSDFILLSDYELIGESATGLELIEQMGIQDRSILATSHYQDIVKQNSTIKVIPKNLVFDLNLVLVQVEPI